ncbi:hypothetical protein [Pseudoalteromonas sp. MTN2-4]|uniref:hypothetical protein n=1 Tax=Pseudoalteromonas sp. MTN2-4 TaxID=3056555 RepID=UPI0036F274DA
MNKTLIAGAVIAVCATQMVSAQPATFQRASLDLEVNNTCIVRFNDDAQSLM